MVGERCVFWLFAFLCLATVCTSDNVWLARATAFLFRPNRQEFLQGEKVRLEYALLEARQTASLLQEENSELKQKVVGLKSSLQSLKKEIVSLRLEHMKEVGEMKRSHAKTTGELRESFKRHRNGELASLTAKLEGKFAVEKKDLVAALKESHAEEVSALKKSLRTADTAIAQSEHKIQELGGKLTANYREIAGFVERERQSVSENEKLKEEVETLTQGLRHIKLAEEARAVDNEGGSTSLAAPLPPPPAARAPPPPEPLPQHEVSLAVPEGVAHTAPHELRAGDPVVVETTSRKTASRKVGGMRNRRPYQSGPTAAGNSNAYGSH